MMLRPYKVNTFITASQSSYELGVVGYDSNPRTPSYLNMLVMLHYENVLTRRQFNNKSKYQTL